MSRHRRNPRLPPLGIDLAKNTFHLVGLDQPGTNCSSIEDSRNSLSDASPVFDPRALLSAKLGRRCRSLPLVQSHTGNNL